MRYLLNGSMEPMKDNYKEKENDEIVELLTTEECQAHPRRLSGSKKQLLHRVLSHQTLEYCKAEMRSGCITGSLLVPSKDDLQKDAISVAYYLDERHLIFVDDEQHLPDIIQLMKEDTFLECITANQFFMEFLDLLLRDDVVFLQSYEKVLSTMEEALLSGTVKDFHRSLLQCRKDTLALSTYYQQMEDMCDSLYGNPNHFFDEDERLIFQILSGRVSRLYTHSQNLREYALQIRELYQSQVDLRTNDIMRILTVVTTIFFPLSLITGWYGMNFRYMPELQAHYGYLFIIVICLILVVFEIWFFKRKKWL